MGAGGSAPQEKRAVDRAGFSDEEYGRLREALGVQTDVPDAKVELPAFLERFSPHLRPFVQPLFFRLARAPVGEAAASWPVFVSSLSGLVRRGGLSWADLLDIWAPGAAGGQDPAAEAALRIELVASLCFWCANPTLTPSDAANEAILESFLSALKCGAADAESGADAARRLEVAVPELTGAIAPMLSHALLGAPVPRSPAALPAESRILDIGLVTLLRSIQAGLWESEPWQPLYRDWADGRSFQGLVKGALHYEGPALLLVRTSNGEIIGALSNCWRETNGKFAGGPECLLFSLLPSMGVFQSESRSGSWVYFNSKNKHHPRGMGFGGQPEFSRLWMDADFEECSVLESDATYAAGALLPPKGMQTKFQPSTIEIWGCGGEEAARAQAAQRAVDEGLRDEARKVDRAKMVENDFDKEMFFGNTFKGASDAREPVDQLKGEEEKK